MRANKFQFENEALTFDDVLLVPSYSEILPHSTDVATRVTRHIKINIPIISSAMDTVTESALAIALAREGGIGIIHKNMSIERQAAEIDKVKRSEAGMIVDPITLPPSADIGDALEVMNKFRISGIPITEGSKLVGILTNRDLRFEDNINRPISEVMTKENLITVQEGVALDEARKLLHKHRIEKLLIVDANFNLKGLITVKDIMKKIQYPHAAKDEWGRLRVGAALGVSPDMQERASELIKNGVDLIVVDSSHGHSKGVIDGLKRLKARFADISTVAGNVATRDGARDLIDSGADAIKVGIGPGTICTTRVVTGAGMPQITAISQAFIEAEKADVPIIADGGIRYSGDITKAIAAGAESVMIGSLFAGAEESPGETILYEGRTYKTYRGMGSIDAMNKGSSDRYFQDHQADRSKLVPEGVEGMVPYRGSLSQMVFQLVGGLRAGMGLCGCKDIYELRTKSKFVRISAAGLTESHPHDVAITKEAPNYQKKD
ncbi:MAG: IMP dehydrogenase [candidate division Zixibacteria bacterium CG_4_9_14_3_um_filter_46_8]|nr:MAG: IMP dehydrogenase [candidate division Zixibacteria bacterium CG_4_9_14_3_um_filter_46_8]